MFGYININQGELKMKDFSKYRMYYCGLCQALKERFGVLGRMSLNYDLTFTAILLSSLYEEKEQLYEHRCFLHPLRKQRFIKCDSLYYVADMNLLLAYYKCLDDWADEKKFSRLLYAGLIRRHVRGIAKRYPEKVALIRDRLSAINACEKAGENQPDIPAGLFGEIMAELFLYKDDVWKNDLSQLGFFLGKYIYLLDAYDDLEKDLKAGNYNVFRDRAGDPSFTDDIRQILILMMGESARAFERLPLIRNAAILRNIIYSGVWTAFYQKTEKED